MPGEPAFQWRPPGRGGVWGLGKAAAVSGQGPERLAQVWAAGKELMAATAVADGSMESWRPRLFGGAAFLAGGAAAGAWRAFGDAAFWLPRWTAGGSPECAWLAVAARLHDGRVAEQESARLLAEARLLAASPVLGARPAPPALTAVEEMPAAAWRSRVEAIKQVISGGGCAKIVTARRTRVVLPHPAAAEDVLDRLLAASPTCTGFLIRHGEAAFVGATPEHLLARRGHEVVAEALAGSWDAGADGAEAALLGSAKDREEHELVVEEVMARLRPFCRRLTAGGGPAVHRLPGLLHLRTPVHGVLRGPAAVLELVEALHPTPAVGGAPREAALAWIAAHEEEPRGWYSGPIGWFDAEGDGEFVVALRCGLLAGSEALVYAGAGIVRDSDPEAEYAETALKQQPMLRALGASS